MDMDSFAQEFRQWQKIRFILKFKVSVGPQK